MVYENWEMGLCLGFRQMNTKRFVTILRERAMNSAVTGTEAVLNTPPRSKAES